MVLLFQLFSGIVFMEMAVTSLFKGIFKPFLRKAQIFTFIIALVLFFLFRPYFFAVVAFYVFLWTLKGIHTGEIKLRKPKQRETR